MNNFPERKLPTLARRRPPPLASPAFAADEPPEGAPKGAAVTVFKAAKACFNNIVEVSGILIPREETTVRSERPGLKVAEVLAEPGDTVTAGQLAGAAVAAGGRADAGGVADRGAGLELHGGGRLDRGGQGRGAVFHHRAQRIRPGRHGAGAGIFPSSRSTRPRGSRSSAPARSTARCAGWPRPSSPTASSARSTSRSPQPRRLLVNSSGRALIKTGQSCGISVPLTAILYSPAGTVVQVVRRGAGRDQAGRGRADVVGPGRNPPRHRGRRHRGGARRRAAARRRSGAAGDGERGCEEVGLSTSSSLRARCAQGVRDRHNRQLVHCFSRRYVNACD